MNGELARPPNSPFVHAHILDGRGGARAITDAEVADWQPDQGVLWVHLETGNANSRAWLDTASGIESLTAEALGAAETRPRSFANPHGLLVILRGVNTNPGADPEDMVSIRVWIGPDRIVSVRRRKLLSIQDIRESLARGAGPITPGDFLVTLVERLALRIEDFVDRIEDALESLDDRVAVGNVQTLQAEVGRLRRQSAAVRRYLAPQREALNRIRGRTEMLSARELHDLEEQADLITRSLEDLELAREQAMLIQEQLTARLAQEQNNRLYVLSIVAAVFLPLSFVTGLLGMNVAGVPGTEYAPAFRLSLVFMSALAVALLAFFRWKRWI